MPVTVSDRYVIIESNESDEKVRRHVQFCCTFTRHTSNFCLSKNPLCCDGVLSLNTCGCEGQLIGSREGVQSLLADCYLLQDAVFEHFLSLLFALYNKRIEELTLKFVTNDTVVSRV